MPKGIYARKTLSERLEELTERDEATGCLYFKGHLDKDGYGQISITQDNKHKTKHVHRVVWESTHGPIEPGLMILHLCDEKYPAESKEYRKCCELSHMRLGTNQDNMNRMKELGRSIISSGAYKKGQQQGGNNTNSKLTEQDVKEIRRIRQENVKGGLGLLYQELATQYKVSVVTIQKIIGNKLWIDTSYTPP